VKAREGLLAIVSHDLRSPMQSILMTASMLDHSSPIMIQMKPRVKGILKSRNHEHLLGDLLDLARFDAGDWSSIEATAISARIVRDAARDRRASGRAEAHRLVDRVGDAQLAPTATRRG